VNTKIVGDGPFILKEEFFTKAHKKCIDGGIRETKDTAIISIENNDSPVIVQEETWIDGRLVETSGERSPFTKCTYQLWAACLQP